MVSESRLLQTSERASSSEQLPEGTKESSVEVESAWRLKFVVPRTMDGDQVSHGDIISEGKVVKGTWRIKNWITQSVYNF